MNGTGGKSATVSKESPFDPYITSRQCFRDLIASLAIQTAVALAEHEAKTASPPQETVKLKTAHIKDVIEMSEIFKKYLSDFKGDEAQRALEEKSRMDKDKQYKPDMAATLAATREKTARRL